MLRLERDEVAVINICVSPSLCDFGFWECARKSFGTDHYSYQQLRPRCVSCEQMRGKESVRGRGCSIGQYGFLSIRLLNLHCEEELLSRGQERILSPQFFAETETLCSLASLTGRAHLLFKGYGGTLWQDRYCWLDRKSTRLNSSH